MTYRNIGHMKDCPKFKDPKAKCKCFLDSIEKLVLQIDLLAVDAYRLGFSVGIEHSIQNFKDEMSKALKEQREKPT